MSTAKEAILARIRQAGTGMAAQAPVAYGEIERSYQSAAALTREQILDLLEERLVEYDAHVYRVAEGEIPGITARLLAERKIARVVVPAGLPPSWVSSAKQGAEFVKDTGFDAATLNGFGGVMTGSTLAMAETGTIVLQDVPGQGRRAITLVPDYHLCVVREQDVVETVVEGMRRLDATRDLPTTFFSGPSATADIEMTRIKGVHGPRFVDVLLVRG